MRTLSRFLALGAFFVAAGLLLAACGGDSVPGNAVAKVGDQPIKRATFDHWMRIAAISSAGQTGQSPKDVQIPQPPDFAACVAQKRKLAPKPAKGQPKPTDAQFRAQCKQEYEGLRDQVLQFLVANDWILGEAKDQGIKATPQEIDKRFQQTIKQSFPKAKDFDKYLATTGMTRDDIRYRVEIDLLSNKLREKIVKGKDQVADKQIQGYYNKNRKRFAQPERRDLRIVLTKTRARAQAAKQALQSGQSWKTVAKRFSIDQASKSQGGVLLAVAKGQQEKALDEAVFKAPKGKLEGPVKTQFGYYVFIVQKVTAASQQSLAQARTTIKQLLASQGQQKALDTFVKDFRKKWKDKTVCRKGYITQDCKNAPKPKGGTTATAPPGTGGPPSNP